MQTKIPEFSIPIERVASDSGWIHYYEMGSPHPSEPFVNLPRR